MNTNNNNSNIPQQVLTLVPWYVSGTLTDEEQALFESALEQYPELTQIITDESHLIRAVKLDNSILDNSLFTEAQDEERLNAVLNKINTLPQDTPAKTATQQAVSDRNTSLLSRLFSFENKSFQYASLGIIGLLFLGLLTAFIAPLLMDEHTRYETATSKHTFNTQTQQGTNLLVELNVQPNNRQLILKLKEIGATIEKVPDNELYRIRINSPLSGSEVKHLIENLKRDRFFNFIGEEVN